MDLALIPPGDFEMGNPPSETSEAGLRTDDLQHHVTLSKGFWMGTCEVTQEQWQQVMGGNPSHFTGAKKPVEMVSWADCQTFLQKLNTMVVNHRFRKFRLPSEAEWEYACRAGTTTLVNLGDTEGDLDRAGWYFMNSGNTSDPEKQTHPVGQKTPNEWGLYDMHGNVSEWCRDWKADYPVGSLTNPAGSSSGSARVVRGGSFTGVSWTCFSASRFACTPLEANESIGFRVVASR
jgi:formylglycine-generating enzyme required for sulfatase activity